MFCQILIFGLGGRGWTERKRRKPRGFGLRPPTPATRHSKFDKALVPQITMSFTLGTVFSPSPHSAYLVMTEVPFQGLMRNLTSPTKPRKSNVWQGSQNTTDHSDA